MLSINTNISSLIAQQSMTSATNKLNQAIERMTTGYKINGAKDNAANYSISQNMQTQLGSYDVAADNVAMGMDLVTTASDIISNMQDKASRLQALCTQARNGTYGAQSMAAINTEAGAIMSEIMRLYSTAEYNQVSLFNREAYEIAEYLPKAGESGFINDNKALKHELVGVTSELVKSDGKYNNFIDNPVTYTDEEVAAMIKLADVNTFSSYGKYSITSVEELEKLATLVNSGVDTQNVTFVLGSDLDLSQIDNWEPIGTKTNPFQGNFDGNGHCIKNLRIDSASLEYAGLFGFCSPTYGSTSIKNLALINVDINAKKYIGALAGYITSHITNCYSTGKIVGAKGYVGGLVGEAAEYNSFVNNYSTCDVVGRNQVGGLVGYSGRSMTKNCYATGNVSGENNVGGLIGRAAYDISYSYATGNVSGNENVGGLAGYGTYVFQSYASGDIVATKNYGGGLIGYSNNSFVATQCHATGNVTGGNRVAGLTPQGNVTYCYSSGDVSGGNRVGGLVSVGGANNCYAEGDVVATGNSCGGLIAEATENVENSYATGNVTAKNGSVGGLVGFSRSLINVTNSYATGDVKGTDRVGGLVGYLDYGQIIDCYATGDVVGSSEVGGVIGFGKTVKNSYSTGDVTGDSVVGGIIGSAMFNVTVSNCYTEGNIKGEKSIGGLIGDLYQSDLNYTVLIEDSISYGNQQGENIESVGGLIGSASLTSDDSSFGTINFTNNQITSDNPIIGIMRKTGLQSGPAIEVDLSELLADVGKIFLRQTSTTLQVGIKSDSSNQITFDTNFKFDLSAIEVNIASDEALAAINDFTNLLSEKSTQLGAVQNRLDSAIESITVNMENLTSSLSTIRDADIAEVSSEYIRQQILQQASATLLATANQSPSIALQLI